MRSKVKIWFERKKIIFLLRIRSELCVVNCIFYTFYCLFLNREFSKFCSILFTHYRRAGIGPKYMQFFFFIGLITLVQTPLGCLILFSSNLRVLISNKMRYILFFRAEISGKFIFGAKNYFYHILIVREKTLV
jgi:hypothetical protein